MNISNKNILITGSHRSGTTWVGKTISQHHRICYIQEPFHVSNPNRFMGLKLNTWFAHQPSSDQREEIKLAFDNLFGSTPLRSAIKMNRMSGIGLTRPLSFGKHLLINSIAKQFLVKDPLALLSAGWLYDEYDLNVICMIRGPVAFVGSLKKAEWDFDFNNLRKQHELMNGLLSSYKIEIDEMCNPGTSADFIDRASLLWNILHFVISRYQSSHPSWLFMRYEDIALNPMVEFTRIFDYLDLDMTRHVKNYITAFTSANNSVESTSNKYQPRDAKASLESWKQRLSEEEIERVESATKEMASHFYQ